MAYIMQFNDGENNIPIHPLLGVCATDGNVATKEVVLSNFDSLQRGAVVLVMFLNSNTAADAKLKVGSTDAKRIIMANEQAPGTTEATSWKAASVVPFVYDGVNAWYMIGVK